jgi:hypothetical protein
MSDDRKPCTVEGDREAAQARCEAATPGNWTHRIISAHVPAHVFVWTTDDQGRRCKVFITGEAHSNADAAFIAHARTDLPAALRALSVLEAEVARLTAALVTLRSMRGHLPYEANVTVEAALSEGGTTQ